MEQLTKEQQSFLQQRIQCSDYVKEEDEQQNESYVDAFYFILENIIGVSTYGDMYKKGISKCLDEYAHVTTILKDISFDISYADNCNSEEKKESLNSRIEELRSSFPTKWSLFVSLLNDPENEIWWEIPNYYKVIGLQYRFIERTFKEHGFDVKDDKGIHYQESEERVKYFDELMFSIGEDYDIQDGSEFLINTQKEYVQDKSKFEDVTLYDENNKPYYMHENRKCCIPPTELLNDIIDHYYEINQEMYQRYKDTFFLAVYEDVFGLPESNIFVKRKENQESE